MNDEKVLGTIRLDSEKITLIAAHYADGRLAVLARDSKAFPYGTLSVNPGPDRTLPPDCIVVKTWSENKLLAQAALASALFLPTGKSLRLGTYADLAPIWRVLGLGDFLAREEAVRE